MIGPSGHLTSDDLTSEDRLFWTSGFNHPMTRWSDHPMVRTRCPSERPFLGEAEAGQGYAIGRFGDLHLHDRCVGRGDLSGPQYRVLREYFAIHLGDKMILAGCILAPDLSEFDALHGHEFSFSSQSTYPAANPSIAPQLPLGTGGWPKAAALLP